MSEKSASSFGTDPKIESARWKQFSRDYQNKVFSATSFAPKRQQILNHVNPGLVIDLGCGPLGLMLRDLALRQQTFPIGADFCLDMLAESRRNTSGLGVPYVAADNRCLPFSNSSIDTIVSVNSFIPETRFEVELVFAEVRRVLRRNGRFLALLPSFEMSLIAQNHWQMELKLDLQDHREWDTAGWQCFYTSSDIERLMRDNGFDHYYVEKVIFSTPEEVRHIHHVYAESLKRAPNESLIEYPLFEHLVIADKI